MVSLSASQLEEIHRMQMRTVEEEDRVQDYVARLQQSMADKPMLISLAASGGDGDECGGKGGEMKKVVMGAKLKQLQELALRADLLRRRTLAGVLRSLNPLQRAQFLLASS
ncbi:hypothetical protein L7F22_064337 [Adiantum nelumboides]|nr:hypothetical protein [Adiantum nelumboides]